jgi:hypothetical protein
VGEEEDLESVSIEKVSYFPHSYKILHFIYPLIGEKAKESLSYNVENQLHGEN